MGAARELETFPRGLVSDVLAETLGVEPDRIRIKPARSKRHDFEVAIEGHRLFLEAVGRTDRATLLDGWEQVRGAGIRRNDVPVILVPFMTELARTFCEEHQINWLDLSGNASIRAPGFRIRISGNPNRHARRGRPSSVFERRSSRLARVLLQSPGRDWSVRECAKATGLNEGHVSRIVARLVEDQLLARDERRRFRVRDPGLLLEAWRDAADFSDHQILRGHVPARSGEELLRLLSKRLDEGHIGHAATGLGAAWLYDHFAMFRLVTFYLREWPTSSQLEHLHFREQPSGANAWLVLPNDDGVFAGSRTIEGVPCAHPVQVFVDLKDQPERASEASEHLRSNPLLLGTAHGS